MSGDATFAGTSYQARVIAYVYAHMLAQARLGWFELLDDTPSAVSGETAGPGDDLRIELGTAGTIEAQAKHGMTAGAKLDEFLGHLVGTQPANIRVVLVVNRASSRKLYLDLADDLDRIRSGRLDGLSPDTEEVRRKLGSNASILERLSVLPVDVDAAKDPEWKGMATLLAHALEDPAQVTAAQAVLADDGNRLCAKKLRRTRSDLVALLEAAKIKTKPPARDERWHRELDFTLRLLKQAQPQACLTLIEEMERSQVGQTVPVAVRYRVLQQKAAALLRLDRLADALSTAMRAVDLDSTRPDALRIAAAAQLLLGDVGEARALAARAIAVAPHDAQVWAIAAQVASAAGEPPLQPPPDVLTADRYRLQLAHIAASREDWQEVLRITEDLLATGSREPETLYLQGIALTTLAEFSGDRRIEHAAKAERVATEMLEQLRSSHPLAVKALVIRSSAKRHLGKTAEADADAALAHDRARDDPEAIRRRAHSLREAKDLRGAIAVLRHPAVSADLVALALRARLLAENGQRDEARADLSEVLVKLAAQPPNEGFCFAAADAAVVLRDPGFAEAALSRAPSRLTDPGYRTLIEGRIAFLRGDLERGEQLLRTAANGPRRLEVLLEVAIRLQRAGRHQEAVRAFQEVGPDALPKDVLADYAAALLSSNALVDAGALLARFSEEKEPLPNWAVRLGAHLALLQEDPAAAIASLTELTTRESTVPASVRLNLASALTEVDRLEEANQQLDLILTQPELSAPEVVRLTLLLKEVGRSKEAIAAGSAGLRRWPQDPQVHRALVGVAMSSTSEFPPPQVVAPGVSVRIETATGTSRWWTIVESGPADPLRGEMSTSDAEAAGFLGRPVGHVLTKNAGEWNEVKHTITEIVPAALHAVHDAMANFADRFPQEPFFASSFKVGDFTKVADFTPFLATLEARKRRAQEVIALYQQHTFPLGFLAQRLGVSIPEVMATLSASDMQDTQLLVEWRDRDGQAESVAAAQAAKTVVMTRSSLQTAFELELLPILRAYTIIVPRSLVRELRLDLRNAEKEAAEGKSAIGAGPRGLELHEIEAGHPQLLNFAAGLRGQLAWATHHARLEPRPLASLQRNEAEIEQLRTLVGLSSADAVDVVRDKEATLYADDLGLRRFFGKGDVVRSFSTVGLLMSLLSRGLIDEARHTAALLALIDRRHTFVPISRALLTGALRLYGQFAQTRLMRVFELLGAPERNLLESSLLVADLVRATALSPVQLCSIERVVSLSLEGMSAAWPPALCAQVVTHAIAEKCALMPNVVRQAERTAAEFLHNKLTMKTPTS